MIAYGPSRVSGPLSASQIKSGADILATKGTAKKPSPPRDVRYLPSSRGAIVVWSFPEGSSDIAKWRIYKDTETNLYTELSDPNVRQVTVELSSGTTPPVTNIFVAAVNTAGFESSKVVIQAQATSETGAPTVPALPPEWDQPPERIGCVEEGTPCEDPDGTIIERIPNADWIVLELGDREPIAMHPDTLVSVWKKAGELNLSDRIDTDANGAWSLARSLRYEHRPSVKEKRTCPGGTYRARGVRLHNAKAPIY